MHLCTRCLKPVQTCPSRFPREFYCQCFQDVTIQDVTFTVIISATDPTASLLRDIYRSPAGGEYERVEVPKVFQKALQDADLNL